MEVIKNLEKKQEAEKDQMFRNIGTMKKAMGDLTKRIEDQFNQQELQLQSQSAKNQHEMKLLHDDVVQRLNVNTIDEEIEEALQLNVDEVKNLKGEFNVSQRGGDSSRKNTEEDTQNMTDRVNQAKKVEKKLSSHNASQESTQGKNLLELAAGLSIKKALHKVKEEIHDNAELERIQMEMNVLKGDNPISVGNTIQTYKHVDPPSEKQKNAVTQFAM